MINFIESRYFILETLLQSGYHYIVPLHKSWGYIQEAYNATRIQHHHTQEQHLTTDETQTELNDIHPASPGCRPGTYPLNEEEAEEELQNK